MRKSMFALATLCLLAAAVTTAQQGQRRAPDPRSMGGGDCRDNPYNCADAPNPLPAATTVWIEEMTWMDVRDALKAGKTTAIISTGGIEPNGPWLVTGKHNYVLHANCDAIARKLGNALCAPIVKYVPEGDLEPKTGHMTSPGTITMREVHLPGGADRYRREPAGARLQDHRLHRRQRRQPEGPGGGGRRAHRQVGRQGHRPAHRRVLHLQRRDQALRGPGPLPKDRKSDGMHDDPVITLNMFIDDPKSVRYDERVKAGKATIDSVSIADRAKATDLAKKIVAFRADHTVAAINKAIAAKGKATMQQ